MKKLLFLVLIGAAIISTGAAIDYDVETSPLATDYVLGIDDPLGSWKLVNIPIANILGLHTVATDPHTGYMLEGNIGDGASEYLQLSATPGTAAYNTFLAGDLTWAALGEIFGVCTVATIPAEPVADDLILITDGDTACDTTTGGGTERYWMQYSGTAWVCLGSSGTGGNITTCTVATIPAAPSTGDAIIVTDGAAPCDATTGGGTDHSLFVYSGSAWNCVSGDEATTPTRILADDTEITITDDGVSAGSIAVEVDGTAVASFTAAGTTLGPIAATATITADDNYSATQLLVGSNGGEAISQWQTVYFDGTAGEYLLADSNASGKWPAAGIAVDDTTNGNPIQVLVAGFARNDTGWEWNPGDPICLSETPGGIVICSDTSICSADGDCAQRIGTAITADIVHFDFTQGWAECNGS